MKRIFATLLCLMTVLTFCVFPASADDAAEVTETVTTEVAVTDAPITEETVPEPSEPLPGPSWGAEDTTTNNHTIFSRIWEFVVSHSEETLTIVFSLILLMINIALRATSKKTAQETKETLNNIKNDVKETRGGQNAVVDVTNDMIDGYNALSQSYEALKQSYDSYGATEDERNRVVGAVLATNTAILEILTTVYVNSKNLPQGVKDIVSLKYANCLKTLDDDKQLRAIVEAVRENIGSVETKTENKTEE